MLLCDRLAGILLLPATRNHVACSSSQQERAEHPTTFAMLEEQTFAPGFSSMSCQACQLVGIRAAIQFISSTSSEQRTHMHVSSVTTAREPFSPQFPFSQRVRSMKSVPFALLRAEKVGVFQTHETLCDEDSLVADAAV